MKPALLALLALLALPCGCQPDRPKQQGLAYAASATAAPLSSASAAPLAPAPLTEEQQKMAQGIVVNDCLACHSEQMLAQQRLTAQQWAAVVKKMQGWGSQVEPANAELLAAFLSARYGTEAPPYVVPTISASAAAEALAPLPDGPFAKGDPQKGAALYKEQCASCHGADGRGSAIGITLVDRPGLYRAPEMAEVVKRGRGRMPAFPQLKAEELGAVIAYLRKIRPS
jgi:cytochrome c1